MRTPSKLITYVAGASTLTLLLATSAFAETRHHDGTSHTNQHGSAPRGGEGGHPSGNVNHNQRSSVPDRNFGNRGNDRNFGNRGNDRSYERNYSRESTAYHGNFERNDSRSFDRRQPERFARDSFAGSRETFRNGIPRGDGRVTMSGRISRFDHERGGYRVWVGGSAYPYWVPESYFFGRRIGIGLDLRFGGVFRNGAVYVDALGWPGDPYYNDPYYSAGSYEGNYSVGAYAEPSGNGVMRGTVDGVDYRAGLLYVRDDSTRRVVTVDMRRVDRRYSHVDFNDLRPGDRVSITGAWVGDSQFAAAGIDTVGGGY
jgi:hypothetical protein